MKIRCFIIILSLLNNLNVALSQINQTIPVIECISDFSISFPNGNILEFDCNEKNLDTNIIRAVPAANNFQFPYVKNYNQSSYDLIWAEEFNGSTIDNKNWRGNLSYHYGLLNKIGQNGIALSDMTQRLMEKVEELTLYLIQQQKEIEQLKQQLKEEGK
jgi:hypothetical protein